MSVGENIRRLRKERGLTQKRLGELSNINEVQIRQYELGKANPKLITMRKIADALGVYIADLVDNDWNSIAYEVKKDFLLYPWQDLEKKLSSIGYSIGSDGSEGYLWINYPDGSLEVTEEQLLDLDKDTDEYLLFKLEQLKKKHIKDFHK